MRLNRPKWGEPPGLWSPTGSFRDVYLLTTANAADWAALISLCAAYPCTYRFDGLPAVLPSVAQIFADRSGSHCLTIQVGRAAVNCHFFSSNWIELDIDPREVVGPDDHAALLELIEELATRTRKRALVTEENCEDEPYLAFDPATSAWSAFR